MEVIMVRLLILFIFICSASFGQVLIYDGKPMQYDGKILFNLNPKALSGLVAWYDSKDTSTISLSGSFVTQWDDKSGNDYHLEQGTAANQPTYSVSDGIVFDGLDDWMEVNPLNVNNPFTFFIVTDYNVTGDFGYFLSFSEIGNIAFFRVNPTVGSITLSTGLQISYTPVYPKGTVLFTCVASNSGGLINENSILKTSGFTGENTITSLNVGRLNVPALLPYYLNGAIKEIIIYNRSLSNLERQYIESYLNSKYTIY
jgi:hypothetical protein